LYRFSQAEYDELSKRLQQVGGWVLEGSAGVAKVVVNT